LKFVGLTRGGLEGVIAIVECDGSHRYYEKVALLSLIEKASGESLQELEKALTQLNEISNLEDIPEFESGIPQQASLF